MNPWKPKSLPLSPNTPVRLIDNRVFLLGLDELYRNAMKMLESERLLPCARTVAETLHLQPADVPIESYYHETPALEEYFRWMRRLQEQDENAEAGVKHLPEFQLLWKVTNSPLYGRPQREGKLFPTGRDPLSQALKDTAPNWSGAGLTKAAYAAALQFDDYSLVGLAARTQDAVVLTALRESVVLYAEVVRLALFREPKLDYEWRVDEGLAKAANRFIETFNRFVPDALPRAEAASAERYYKAYTDSEILGRCVRLGQTPDGRQHYHWAIMVKTLSRNRFELAVDEFWTKDIWTTKKYRETQGSPATMKPFSKERGSRR
jgi:hypothetical protein